MNNPEFDATEMYYGQFSSDTELLLNISWSVLGRFAEKYRGIPAESVKQFDSQLTDLEI